MSSTQPSQENVHIGLPDRKGRTRSPWFWIPSLYFAEGIPYIVAMTVSVVMFKTLGISNTAIAFWTSILYLPWVIKPLWGPLVDIVSTKRNWVFICQLLLGVCFAGVALILSLPLFFTFTIIILWLVAFTSASHDIAADGFYMLGLSTHQQAWFTGIRSTFYRLAMLTGQGLLVIIAGYIQSHSGLDPVDLRIDAVSQLNLPQQVDTTFFEPAAISDQPKIRVSATRLQLKVGIKDTIPVLIRLSQAPENKQDIVVTLNHASGSKDINLVAGGRLVFNESNWNQADTAFFCLDHRIEEPISSVYKVTAGNIILSWSVTFGFLAGLFILFAIYHLLMLPLPFKDVPGAKQSMQQFWVTFEEVFVSFFKRKHIISLLGFLLFYRFAESQLVKLASPFLLDVPEKGGLGLSTSQVGFAYGTVGIACLTIGGILGGIIAARYGLKKWLWPMAIAINIPDVVYVFLSQTMTHNLWLINLCVGIEQLGYGFGFTAYMLVMLYASKGKYETAHYALATGLMSLGMMLPGMISGYIQQLLGYSNFFIWIMIAVVPAMLPVFFIKIDPEFGKR
ncbi:MFS transporter [candidate division KSB1 bacterium]|nr:MFS transporter [candidate division KSB1 bacterium]